MKGMQTAWTHVCDKEEIKMQVLFVGGSNKTFITAKAASHLELKTVWRERLLINAFGRKNSEVEMRDVADLSLNNLRRVEKGVKIEVFVIDNIADISNMHTKIVKE